MKRMIDTRAFTLIELVMVIVILGILAAAAIPKFTDLTSDAHSAVMEGTVGAVRSGIYIVRSENLIDGDNTANNGWPLDLDTESGGASASTTTPLFVSVLDQGILENWLKVSAASGAGTTSQYQYTGLDTTGGENVWTYTNNTGTFLNQ